jgi:hypothetical protein
MTDNLLSTDPGKELLILLVGVMKGKLQAANLPPKISTWDVETRQDVLVPNPEYVPMTAAEMTAILALLRDSSVTLASIKRGDFGETAQRAAIEFPFPEGTAVQ